MHTEIMHGPWAMEPARFTALMSKMQSWTGPESRTAKPTTGRSLASQSGGIAVLSLTGVLTQNGLDPFFGQNTSTTQFSQALQVVLADDSIGSIILDINSPGGSVYGIEELSDQIYQARSQKPILAIANSLAASAAYWIASQATEFYCVPSGETGSIGVWELHQDFSQAMENAGIKTTLISAGKYKTEGNPFEPLDPEAQSFKQSRVGDYHGAFVRAVARGRGVPVDIVRRGMGEGRLLGAHNAKKANMIDGLLTLPQLVQRIRSGGASLPGRKADRFGLERAHLTLLGRSNATPKLDRAHLALARLR